jgi:hypothetical protein
MIYVKIESLKNPSTILFPADGVFHRTYGIEKGMDESAVKIKCRRDYDTPFGIEDQEYPYSVILVRLVLAGADKVVDGRPLDHRKLGVMDMVFQNVMIYIMNEEGQTVDSIQHFNNASQVKTGKSTNSLLDINILHEQDDIERVEQGLDPRDD